MAVAGGTRRAVASLVVMCAGLVVLVVGTFLPWLSSGSVERNSFAADASVRTLLDVHGAAGTALRSWPGVIVLAAAAVALVALDLPRPAMAVAAAVALVAGGLSIAVLVRSTHGLVHLDRLGPAVTVLGCGLTWAAIAAYFVQRRSSRRAQ